ncbi:MAG: hypothetical protein HY079_00110 [Elusimicrobia bacterium]|nr:hypothetical protein [Elusimicrobiota bacterium]
MKGRGFAAGLLVAIALGARAAEVAPTIDPPPGWTDVTAQRKARGVLLALRGPEASTFVVAKMPASAGASAASLRGYLNHALDRIRAGAGADYRSSGRVETKVFRNGVTAHYLRAEAAGRPVLLVAALDAGGPPVLATLSSAAPEAMMAPLFGALRMGGPAGAVHDSGVATSLDGQLAIALGGGLRSRDLTPEERQKGAVLAIQGSGSEVIFVKVEEEDAAPKDQAAIARATVSDAAQTPLEKVSPARRAATAAGPGAVYAWAKMGDSPDLRFAAGFLPWAYWGYSLFARGPQADELLTGSLAALKEGPRAVHKLVAASPRLTVPERGLPRSVLLATAVGAGVLAVLLLAWSRRRKNATVEP